MLRRKSCLKLSTKYYCPPFPLPHGANPLALRAFRFFFFHSQVRESEVGTEELYYREVQQAKGEMGKGAGSWDNVQRLRTKAFEKVEGLRDKNEMGHS